MQKDKQLNFGHGQRNRHYLGEDVQLANKSTKGCSVSLVFEEMHCDDIPLHAPADGFSVKQKIASAYEDVGM